jgi:hypothetical protein
MMCRTCLRHVAVMGLQCLYCQGMNPPQSSLHRFLKRVQTVLKRPVETFHRLPDLVR